MWLVGVCIFGMLIVSIASLVAAVYWEEDDKWLSQQFIKVSWWSIAAALLFLGIVIVI